ncbi:stem-specific protein TSJT1-like [Olea europaea var. sylvestris]|uniref:stem-specific protein TSJT1-like n=1 Tax=Olea europaea var. sylvestris TaxID=158386 RepID=UPI000C1CF248|nr:stem-specific protein TSJT1-like [Olea europaea var. sylvestris]
MLTVFEKSIGKPPQELSLPLAGSSGLKNTRQEIAEIFRSWRSDSTFYNFRNGNFLALSREDQNPVHPRSIVVMDDIFCIFSGALDNTCDLRRYYGLSRQATEAMIIIEAYKVLRDRAPYPPDQVIKELEGKFAFILFDSKASVLLLARDRDGSVQLHWGTAADGSLVCSDDPNLISAACGKCYTPFPPGCIFMSGTGLICFDHPLHKVRAIAREDDEGNTGAVIFQVDLFTRLPSIPRTGSAANWAGATAVEGE